MFLDESPKSIPFLPEHQRTLREQKFDDHHPGTILHDFHQLLDCIGDGEIEVAGKLNLLPIKILPELNRRMSEPIVVSLKRPQLRSYPNLQGLYLLLRASGLGVVNGSGPKARLSLNRPLLRMWSPLNPTERYFHLLESWLVRADAELIGESRGGMFNTPLLMMLQKFTSIPAGGKQLEKPTPNQRPWFLYDAWTSALMWLFGMITIEQRAPEANTAWSPKRIRPTAWGTAMARLFVKADGFDPIERTMSEPAVRVKTLNPEPMGQMQPLFASYIPAWHNNLNPPQREFRNGIFVFKVAFSKTVWRRIALPAKETLDDLAEWILRAYRFDDDHLYEFLIKDISGAIRHAQHPICEGDICAEDIRLGNLPTDVGGTFTFVYDFGDCWRFEVQLERVDPKAPAGRKKVILETAGKSPPQYGDDEDGEYEDDDADG